MSAQLRKPLLYGDASQRRGQSPSQGRSRANSGFEAGSRASSVVLMCSAAIGTGVLALPYAVSCVGIVPALGLFALAGTVALMSNMILFQCVQRAGVGSYGELMQSILGKDGATVLDSFVCIEGIGAVATYLVFIMDYVPQICAAVREDMWCTNRTNVALVASLVIWPLSCSRGLSALRYVSTCSIATLMFTAAVVVVKAPSHFARFDRSLLEALTEVRVQTGTFFQVLSIAFFAFMTHTNTPEIAFQMRAPSGARVRGVLFVHTGGMLAFYIAIGVCGYLAFLEEISQDFLTNYDVSDVMALICRVFISLTLVFACSINLFPAMQALFNVLDRVAASSSTTSPQRKAASLYDQDVPRVIATTIAYAVSLGIALRTPRVADLISTLATFFTAPLMLLFPAMMHRQILENTGWGIPILFFLLTLALWLAECLRLLYG